MNFDPDPHLEAHIQYWVFRPKITKILCAQCLKLLLTLTRCWLSHSVSFNLIKMTIHVSPCTYLFWFRQLCRVVNDTKRHINEADTSSLFEILVLVPIKCHLSAKFNWYTTTEILHHWSHQVLEGAVQSTHWVQWALLGRSFSLRQLVAIKDVWHSTQAKILQFTFYGSDSSSCYVSYGHSQAYTIGSQLTI